MLTRSLDLPPYWDKPHTSQEFNFFRLCSPELRAFAVVRYVICRARSVAPREPHAQGLASRKRIARVCIRCCSALFSSVCWTERARACGACVGAGRFIAHARVFSQRALTNVQHTSQPINHTKHTRQTKHHTLVPINDRVVLREARRHAHPSFPRDRHAIPSRTTLLHTIPRRTDSRNTRPHIRDASRARVPDVTRADGHERVIHNVRSPG